MFNKYQQALNFFTRLPYRVPLKFANDEFCKKYDKNFALIKELVDKVTPKNPILVMHGKVKMTAKEMFEELGWKKVYESQCSIIYERGFRTCSFIKKNEKEVAVDSSGHISMNMLKAINQQCKELGWI